MKTREAETLRLLRIALQRFDVIAFRARRPGEYWLNESGAEDATAAEHFILRRKP